MTSPNISFEIKSSSEQLFHVGASARLKKINFNLKYNTRFVKDCKTYDLLKKYCCIFKGSKTLLQMVPHKMEPHEFSS